MTTPGFEEEESGGLVGKSGVLARSRARPENVATRPAGGPTGGGGVGGTGEAGARPRPVEGDVAEDEPHETSVRRGAPRSPSEPSEGREF